jgi:hypothetical protein
MRSTKPKQLSLVIPLLLLVSVTQAGFREDHVVLLPPDYDTLAPPSVGEFYRDPVFVTAVNRMTDALRERTARLTPEYSSSDVFNADESVARLMGEDVFFVSTEPPYRILRWARLGSSSASDYWWDVNNPEIIYHISQGNRISAYNYESDRDSTVREFRQFSRVKALGEDNLSLDGDRLALYGDDRFVFVYEFSTDSIIATLDTQAAPMGGRSISDLTTTPSGDGVIIGWSSRPGSNRAQGMEFFKIQGTELVFQRQLASRLAHHDVGQDTSGDDYLVIPRPTDYRKDIFAVRTSDGQATNLGTFGGEGFWHDVLISCNSMHNDDYVYVAAYKEQEVPEERWAKWVNELLRVKVSGGPIERIAHHRSRPHDGYWSTPRASISRSGRYLIFPSNFNRQANESGIPRDYVDTYIIDILSHSHIP